MQNSYRSLSVELARKTFVIAIEYFVVIGFWGLTVMFIKFQEISDDSKDIKNSGDSFGTL